MVVTANAGGGIGDLFRPRLGRRHQILQGPQRAIGSYVKAIGVFNDVAEEGEIHGAVTHLAFQRNGVMRGDGSGANRVAIRRRIEGGFQANLPGGARAVDNDGP